MLLITLAAARCSSSLAVLCRVPLWLAVIWLAAATELAFADRTTDQITFAASGRFDELEKMLEQDAARGPLKTPDQHALCYAYSKTKRYDRLLDCLDRLEKNIAGNDKRTRLFGLDDATPVLHLMRADAFVDLSRYADAIEQGKRALDWYRKTSSADRDMEINALATLAVASALMKNRTAAVQYIGDLVKVNVSWPLYNQFTNAKTMALARSYLAVGDYAKVVETLTAVSLFKLDAFLDDLVSGAVFKGYSNWAWVELPRAYMLNKGLLETGRTTDAKAGLDRLMSLSQVQANGDIYWLILFDRGRIAEGEKADSDALDFYIRAVDVIEKQRSSVNTEANKIGFVGDKQAVYGRLVATAIRLKRVDVAYGYVERSKARALVDMLAGRETIALPPDASVNVKARLADYRRAIQDSVAQVPVDGSRPDAGKRNLTVERREELAKAAPELASLISVEAVAIPDLQGRLAEGECFIEFFYNEGGFYGFVVGRKDIRVVPLKFDGLEQDVRRYRRNLQDLGREERAIGESLYQRLIAPLGLRPDERELIIVPHGLLHYVPFAALHDGGDYLLASRTLRYLPSATVIRYLRPVSGGGLSPILMLGNPDLDNAGMDLPNAETEVRNISGIRKESEVLVRKQATESAFKKFSGAFRYLHIASHGEFDSAAALQSRLVLAKDGENDGSLTVGEIYGLKLSADLVTLSACETGLGDVMNGDDVVGLTRGFLYAGASNIVASLWMVDDAATSHLMVAFYQGLVSGKRKSEALREAQQVVRQKYPHPFFWAAFFITGQGT